MLNFTPAPCSTYQKTQTPSVTKANLTDNFPRAVSLKLTATFPVQTILLFRKQAQLHPKHVGYA